MNGAKHSDSTKRPRLGEAVDHIDDHGVTFTTSTPTFEGTHRMINTQGKLKESRRRISADEKAINAPVHEVGLRTQYVVRNGSQTQTDDSSYTYPMQSSQMQGFPKANPFLADASLFDDLFNNFEEFPIMTAETRTDRDHHATLTHGLSGFLSNKHFCDVLLVAAYENHSPSTSTEARELVHAVVVSSMSRTIAGLIAASQAKGSATPKEEVELAVKSEPSLEAILDKNKSITVVRLKMDGSLLSDVVKYIYSGSAEISSDKAIGMLAAANYLRLSGLSALCCEVVKEGFSPATVLVGLEAGREQGQGELELAALDYIDNNFQAVASHASWASLPAASVRKILQRDALGVGAEVEVFRALVTWASANPGNQSDFQSMVNSNDTVRLPNMSRSDLIEVSQSELVESSEVLRTTLYNEAIRRVQNAPPPSNTRLRRYGLNPLPSAYPNQYSSQTGPTLVPRVPERTLVGHLKAVCAIALYKNLLISGSSDGEIWAWDTDTWECTRRLMGHANSVVSLKCVGEKLVSGSPDQTIRVWNLDTWELEHELKPGSSVCALAVCRGFVCSGSDNGQIMVWDTTVWRGTAIVKAHTHVIWSLVDCGGLLVSGSSDSKIKVWDPASWQCKATLTRHQDEVQALVVAGDMLVSGSDDGVVNIWNRHSWTLLRTLGGNNHAILSLGVWGNSLIAGLGNGDIIFWDLETMTESLTLTDHSSCVMALLVSGNRLMSASYDKSIKIWSLK